MNDEIQKLQADLEGLQPAALDPALLDRLEMAVQGELEQLDPHLKTTESLLAAQQAAKIPAELAERLGEVTRKTAFPVGEKVVLFPGESAAKPSRNSKGGWFAAAACVALAGALAAFFVNPSQQDELAGSGSISQADGVSSPAMERGDFVPASFDSGVSDASDLGVVWAAPDRPVRVVKVVYIDKVKLLNEEGEEIVATTPRVEYLVVPENVD